MARVPTCPMRLKKQFLRLSVFDLDFLFLKTDFLQPDKTGPNERAQKVLLTIVSDQKLPQRIHFLSQLSAPIKTGLSKKHTKALYFDENTPKILYFDV